MNLRYKKKGEDTEQILFMQWCRHHEDMYPQLCWIHHIPNGGRRDAKEAAVLKQMGVKAGVSDIHFPYPSGKYIGMYIEMKFGTNMPSKEQREFLREMELVGHYCCICYSAAAAVKAVEEYINLSSGAEMNGATFEEPLQYQIHKTWGVPVIK